MYQCLFCFIWKELGKEVGDNVGVYIVKREYLYIENDGGFLLYGSVFFILKYGMFFFKYLFFFGEGGGEWMFKGGWVGVGRKKGKEIVYK